MDLSKLLEFDLTIITKVQGLLKEVEELKKQAELKKNEAEQLAKENNLQSLIGEVEGDKPKTPRVVNIHINHFRLKKLLTQPQPVDTFFDEVKKLQPDLTEENYKSAMEHWKSKKYIEEKRVGSSKKTEYHWIKE